MAANFEIVGNQEILQVAESVAKEKGILKDSVIDAMQQALQIAGRKKYGHELEIRADIDPKTGGISLFRQRTVVEIIEDPSKELTLDDAKVYKEDAAIGDIIEESLPPIEFGRVTAQTAKQVIVQKVRDAERQKQYEDFKDRVGEIINGIVKRVEFGSVTVELMNKTEALLRKDEIIPREVFKQNDRVRALIIDVKREKRGAQVFLSRTHPDFLSKLFAQEVPEIYDNVIEIKAVARDPGSRAKIAVTSHDSNIDPVGSCVGVRGSRVQTVVSELQGEKIDIVEWSNDPATYVINALAPAEVSKIVIDEENKRIEVVVPDEQLSLAIGRRGQNVRLASQLVNWNIDVMTEEEESKKRNEEFQSVSKLFMDTLNVEDVIAHLLVTEGFKNVEEVAYVPVEELATIEGFNEEVAAELNERATGYLAKKAEEVEAVINDLKIEQALVELEGLTPEIVIKLGEKGVKTLDDFADLARDEFIELVPDSGKTNKEIDEVIMAARAHWFDDEEKDAVEGDGEQSAADKVEDMNA